MTIEAAGHIPELTLGWRMKMSLGDSEVGAGDMASYLGVSRQTISRWMADLGAPPKRAYLRQWSLKTGVPLGWLETGIAPEPEGPGGETAPAGADDGTRTRNILLGRQRVGHLRMAA